MTDYDELYRAESPPPWEIGRPQPAMVEALDRENPGPKVLDVGCGTGELAIALARRGFDVTAVDISPVAIDRTRNKAAWAGVTVHIDIQDATALTLPAASFDTIVDSGLLHSLDRYGGAVDDYVSGLAQIAAPDAVVLVLAMSREGGQPWGMTAASLRACFPEPTWRAIAVRPARIAAQVDGRQLLLPALLLRAVRAD